MRQLFQFRFCLWPLFLIGLCISSGLSAQRNAYLTPGVFEYLNGPAGDQMSLKTDVSCLKLHRRDRSYQRAILRTGDKKWAIQVRTCGQYRLKNGDIPPLKLKFCERDLLNAGFDTFENVKIVLPFYADPRGEELLVREYLAYKMFEVIDGNAVRARLTSLNLKDTGRRKKQNTLALLLEDDAETAARLGSNATDQPGIPVDSLEQYQAALTAVFQYMIGNTDWSFRLVRNVRLFVPEGGGPVLSMPFDFDFSGLVNAPYATPSPETGLKSVRERLLMADGISSTALEMAVTTFRECKPELLALCHHPLLSEAASNDMTAYLERFFSDLETGKDQFLIAQQK